MHIDYREDLLDQLSTRAAELFGLSYPASRRSELAAKLARLARPRRSTEDTEELRSLLEFLDDPANLEASANALMIGETYFFREPHSLAFIVDFIRSRLARGTLEGTAPSVHVWCAGCSTGEEPYSIAIALKNQLPAHEVRRVSLVASDANPVSLEKARTGVYTEWSFRKGAVQAGSEHFVALDARRRQVVDPLRNSVEFVCVNLAHCDYPPEPFRGRRFDAIICRNVLMYLTETTIARVAAGFERSLKPGGVLVVGAADGQLVSNKLFVRGSLPPFAYHRRIDLDEPESSPFVLDENRVVDAYAVRAFTAEIVASDMQTIEPATMRGGWEAIAISAHDTPASPSGYVESPSAVGADAGDVDQRARSIVDDSTASIEACAAGLERDCLDHRMHYILGCHLREQGRFREALTSFRRALFLEPYYLPALVATASVHGDLGEARLGQKHYRAAQAALEGMASSDVVDDLGGLTVKRLAEFLQSMTQRED